MKNRLRFPIRLKILIALLSIVTIVISLITFTMAEMFHEDKETYISDLASIMAMSSAEECGSVLSGYRNRLQMYGRLMGESDLTADSRRNLLKDFFTDAEDLVAVTLHKDGKEIAGVYDVATLVGGGLSEKDFREYRLSHPFPDGLSGSKEIWLENSTLHEDLPTITFAQAMPPSKDGTSLIISIVARSERLRRISERSPVFEILIVGPNGMLLTDSEPAGVGARARIEFPSEVEGGLDEHSAGVTLVYEIDDRLMIGGFASAGVGGVTVCAQIPRSAVNMASRALLKQLLIIALGLLVLAVLTSSFGSALITRPLDKLASATTRIAKGEFDVTVAVSSRDEVGTLAQAFNRMTTGLKERDTALEEAHSQLVQSEKMAAFGQLGAGIAHEIKNPLAGILAVTQLTKRKSEDGTPLRKNLDLIEKETKRCKSIIDNLLRFARQEKATLETIEINPVVEDAIAIVNHQLELNQVKLRRELGESLLPIRGNANQLQQVVMNLMINAQQAMDGAPGVITVSTAISESGSLMLRVADDGPGMSAEVMGKIYEPFFTTKRSGKGTGLGLSVSFGIIEDHGGKIAVESELGEGTTFTISMPTVDRSLPEVGEKDRIEPESVPVVS